MKDIRPRLISLFKKGYCTPQIGRIAKELKEPAATIHYNVKKLETEGIIRAYKAVFDYKAIDEGFCTYILINLRPDTYGEPEEFARELAKYSEIESVDIVTGDYEVLAKLRTKDIDSYYAFVKMAIKKHHLSKITSLTSLKQVKTEFVS